MNKESQIQRSIMDYLELLEAQGKLWFVRANSGAFKTLRKDGSQGFVKTGKAGCPDIVICANRGQFVGVEVKTPEGRLSPAQELTSRLIDELGAIYIVARSVEELKNDFKTLNLI